MILIGQFDSPFARRVGIALHEYGLSFEHLPWSVWRDAEKIAAYNPLRRVPTLVLDDGTPLIESGAILDALDEMVGDAHPQLIDEARYPRLVRHAARCEARPSFQEISQPFTINLAGANKK